MFDKALIPKYFDSEKKCYDRKVFGPVTSTVMGLEGECSLRL